MPLSSLSWFFIVYPASVFWRAWDVDIRCVMTPSGLFFFFIRWFSLRGRVMSLVFRILIKVGVTISFSLPCVCSSLIIPLQISFFMIIMPSFLAFVVSMAFFLVFLFFFGFLFFFSFLFLCFISWFTIFYTTPFKFLSLLNAFSYRICVNVLSWLELFVSVYKLRNKLLVDPTCTHNMPCINKNHPKSLACMKFCHT